MALIIQNTNVTIKQYNGCDLAMWRSEWAWGIHLICGVLCWAVTIDNPCINWLPHQSYGNHVCGNCTKNSRMIVSIGDAPALCINTYRRSCPVVAGWPGISWCNFSEVDAGTLVLKMTLFPSHCMCGLISTNPR